MSNLSKTSYKIPSLLTVTLMLPLVGCYPLHHPISPPMSAEEQKIYDLENIPFKCKQVDTELAKNLKMSLKSLTDGTIVPTTFKRTLKSYIRQASSMQCDFPLARAEGLIIKTSDDKKLRVFAWDDRYLQLMFGDNYGGTMQYEGIYQFKDNNDKVHLRIGTGYKNSQYEYVLDGVPNALFTETLNGTVTYMLASTGLDSNKVHNQVLQLLTINGDTLQPADIIKTNSIISSLTFRYDFFSVVDRPERPIQMFEYAKQSKTISFPVVIKDSEYPSGKVTNNFINYRFDGTYFQRVKS